MRSDTDGRSLALIVLWVVGIAVMLMPLFMDWVSVDAVLVDGDAVSSMSGLDAMMGRGAEAVPGGFMAMVIVWSALASAVMAVVTWFDVRIGFIGVQMTFAVLTAIMLTGISSGCVSFIVDTGIQSGSLIGESVTDLVPAWVQGMFGSEVVSALVTYNIWNYLGAAGLLVSWMASYLMMRRSASA